MKIVDTHTHAFPDGLAERAITALAEASRLPIPRDGTLGGLTASMDEAGIAQSWVCSIATRPDQFQSILNWSCAIASERIVPLASVHPDDPDADAHVRQIHARGLIGMKFHPYYQEFDIDEARMDPVYAAAEELGLVILFHAGFDPAFPRIRRAACERIARVAGRFPRLNIIAAHLGGWIDWEMVEKELVGRNVYLDCATTIPFLGLKKTRAMILAHGPERVLFATDWPWASQKDSLAAVRSLGLGAEIEEAIFSSNAQRLMTREGA